MFLVHSLKYNLLLFSFYMGYVHLGNLGRALN